jgi:hypothetical protein
MQGDSREVLLKDAPRITALAIDSEAKYLFWSDFLTGQIRRVRLDTGSTELLVGENSFERVPWPTGIAVDSAGGHLYASDVALDAIVRVGIDGTEPIKLITEEVVNPAAITIDATSQRVYWSNRGGPFQQPSEYDYYIMSAKLDGTDIRREFLPRNAEGVVDEAIHLAIIQVPVPEPTALQLLIVAGTSIAATNRLYRRHGRPDERFRLFQKSPARKAS